MFSFLGRPRGAAALMSASAIALVASMSSAYAQEQQRSFNIPAQPLSSALIEFSRQSDVMVVADPSVVNGRRAPALQGNYTPTQALNRLLAGSGLTASQRAEGGFVLASAASPTRLGAADQAVSSEDEIIVTAQKREERLQEVPVPVAVLSTDLFSRNNQVRIEDYFARVPGLNLTPTTQSAQILSIRGITTGAGNPTVGVVIDDVPYGASASVGGGNRVPDIDPGEIERIEVLRGPQGTLYGASSMGGLFKFITRDPSTDGVSGRVQASTASINGSSLGYSVRGSVNVPLSDVFAVRANIFDRHDPGYIDNIISGQQDVNETDASGGRLAALWRPSNNFSLKLNALYQRIQGDGASIVTVGPGFGDLQQGTVRNTGQYDREAQAYSAVMDTNFGAVSLVSLTGYNINSFYDVYDASAIYRTFAQTNFGVPGAPLTNDNETRKFTQEVRLTTSFGENFDLMIGGFYADEDSTFTQQVLAATPASGVIAGTIALNSFPTTYRESAVFGNATFRFSDQFDIQIGGRQSWIEQTYSQVLTGFLGNLNLPAFGTEAEPFTYLVTPRFRVSDNLMIYARAASGFRAGGLNASPALPTYGPDRTQNYEIGMKGQLLGGVGDFDLSVYRIDWEDLQIRVVPATGGSSRIENAGEARSTGIELALNFRPSEGLTISTSMSFNKAEVVNFPTTTTVLGLEGDPLPNSPDIAASASFDQQFPLSSNLTGFVGASWSYVGDRLGDFRPRATPLRQDLPAYSRVDLRGGVRFDGLEANVFVNNVTDERGVLAGGIGQTPPDAFYYIQPRTIGVSLTKEF